MMEKTKGFKPKLTKHKDGTKVVSIREDCIFFAEDFAKLPKNAVIIVSRWKILVPGSKTKCHKKHQVNCPSQKKTGFVDGEPQRKN